MKTAMLSLLLLQAAQPSQSSQSPAPQNFTFQFDSSKYCEGPHIIAVKAYDKAGNVGMSPPVIINTTKDCTAPAVTLTASVANNGTVSMTATVIEAHILKQVDFMLDGNVIATDPIAPYTGTFKITGQPGIKHQLSARAMDMSGNIGLSPILYVSK